jgi:hypothetical protein
VVTEECRLLGYDPLWLLQEPRAAWLHIQEHGILQERLFFPTLFLVIIDIFGHILSSFLFLNKNRTMDVK